MKSSVALEGHFCSSNWLVHTYCVLDVGGLLAHNVALQTNDNHRQSDLNHCLYCFVWRSRTILHSVMIMIKTEVVC